MTSGCIKRACNLKQVLNRHSQTDKMKFVLILLMTSVLMAKSQKKPIFWPVTYAPRIHLLPFYFESQEPASDFVAVNSQDDHSLEGEAQESNAELSASFGRNTLQSRYNIFSRAFILPNLLPTTTTTIFTTIPSTLTTIVVSSCIPSTLFSTTVVNAVTTTLSAVCARRKRFAHPPELLHRQDGDGVSPSPTQIILASTVPEPKVGRNLRIPELESSQDLNPTEEPATASIQRQNRAITLVTAVTSTITSYSFTSTVVLKSVSLATTSQLFCRPAGFTVC